MGSTSHQHGAINSIDLHFCTHSIGPTSTSSTGNCLGDSKAHCKNNTFNGEFHDVEMDSNVGSIIVIFALAWFEFDRFYFDRF